MLALQVLAAPASQSMLCRLHLLCESDGQYLPTSDTLHVSENQSNCGAALIHPPIPTLSPSAMASAAAMQRRSSAQRMRRMLRIWSRVKQDASHLRA